MLHFDLKVNEQVIGRVEAVRQEREVPADRMCTYDVRVWKDELQGEPQYEFIVRHNYDHGAFSLIRMALTHVWIEDALDGELS
jgi:hypothetical protein